LHDAEGGGILIRAGKNQGADQYPAQCCHKVAAEENHLQPEQAGALEDVFEAKHGILPEGVWFFQVFDCSLRLRDGDDEQRCNGDDQGDQVNDQDAADADWLEQGGCQNGCQDA